jgi:hypothetical protein
MDVEEVTDGVISDAKRQPPGQPPRGEYQLVQRARFHRSPLFSSDESIIDEMLRNNGSMAGIPKTLWPGGGPANVYFVTKDNILFSNYGGIITQRRITKVVTTGALLPRNLSDWPGATVGMSVAVEVDVNNGGHRWVYTIREISETGWFRYDNGQIADYEWNTFTVDWMSWDWYSDYPNIRQRYPDIPFMKINDWYSGVELPVLRKVYDGDPNMEAKIKNFGSYVHDMTVDDISVFNWTTKEWEDLTDTERWQLEVTDDPRNQNYGFKLTFLGDKPGDPRDNYNYDMKLYLNKKPENQIRNQELVRNAKVEIMTSIIGEVLTNAERVSVYTGRSIRIRKLFPYRHSSAYAIGKRLPRKEYGPAWFIAEFMANPDVFEWTGIGEKHQTTLEISLEEVPTYHEDLPDIIEDYGAIPPLLLPPGGNITIFYDMIKYAGEFSTDHNKFDYMHFRNQLHLGDIKIFNRTTKKFENLLDPHRWEVWFKNDHPSEAGRPNEDPSNFQGAPPLLLPDGSPPEAELTTEIEPWKSHTERVSRVSGLMIADMGVGFENGRAFGYNAELDLYVFGVVQAEPDGRQGIVLFVPLHFPLMPESGIVPFKIYQRELHGLQNYAIVNIEFETKAETVVNDGYIHKVSNPMAPITREMRLIPKNVPENTLHVYEVIIDLTARKYQFVNKEYVLKPKINIPGYQKQEDCWYLLINNVRYPMVNPATGLKTLNVVEHTGGVEVTFVGLYKQHERLEFRTLPYPVRSVYVQRHIPKHGFVDLAGKLNKPLSKKYYEFWVNGKLMLDEVTIISPTKLFLHGLTSLLNFEIIEINRDPHEYFSDTFLETPPDTDRPTPFYNFKTYLDGALEGDRLGDDFDIYSEVEQKKLLEPVWVQVARDHPDYKLYPENSNTDRDILARIYNPEDLPLPDHFPETGYEMMIVDGPFLEKLPLVGRDMKWEDFGWQPIGNQEIINMLNEEWKAEIESDPYLNYHYAIGDDEWYGTTAKLYDEFGIQVHNLSAAFYSVPDTSVININTSTNKVDIIHLNRWINLDVSLPRN